MTDTNDQTAARARIADAQEQMQQVNADTERINEFTQWLREASDRAEAFSEYYTQSLHEDAELSAFGPDEHPDVTGEDLPYLAVVDHDSAARRLLREVTRIVTSDLDD